MSSDTCNATTADGTPCANSACRSDGRCWIHTQTDESADNGRPTKLTKQREEGIASMIEEGHSQASAARAHGINPDTLTNWINKGKRQDQGIFSDFFGRIARARAYSEQQYVKQLRHMADDAGDADTLRWMLQQRFPESWGDTDTDVGSTEIEITVDDEIDELHEQWE